MGCGVQVVTTGDGHIAERRTGRGVRAQFHHPQSTPIVAKSHISAKLSFSGLPFIDRIRCMFVVVG